MAAHPVTLNNPSEYQLYNVLERANLLGYFNSFIQQGGDDVNQLCEASEEEFSEILSLVGMATKPLHIRRLQKVLQEWAQENNVAFHPAQSSAQINNMGYAQSLSLQTHNSPMAMGAQWGQHAQSTTHQWNPGQPLGSESTPKLPNEPSSSSSFTPQSMSPRSNHSQEGKGSGSEEYTDPRTLRRVAQRLMMAHTPASVAQTGQNKKLFSNVQHVLEMSNDHPRRLEEIQKWAPIYGRFDSKRKDDKPLTVHEVAVNEAAILLCCIDPFLLVQRDKLFPLSRQVVRESGYQFKHGHSRSLKHGQSKTEEGNGGKCKRIKLEPGVGTYRESDSTTPNPRTVQAEIVKLRREERMNEVLNSLNTIVQKQSDIKASIAAARSEDNIQQVYDLKVQLEKLTTQQLLLMTEQTDLIKRQRRSDRYYVAKARAEEEHGDLARSSDSDSDDSPDNHQKDESTEPDRMSMSVSSTPSTLPSTECPASLQDKQPKKGNSDLTQNLLMQHTLMNEGLRVAQNYALVTRGRSSSKPTENGQHTVKSENCQEITDENNEEAVSRAAESTITALLSLSSNNKNQRMVNNNDANM
ncbi:NGFI-A-binding protein 1-like [Asterias rubens]|uniref:NGFI-A-binding protein 1-like n=1 Tax=Asterias rubens TaxID=7604 RepID=UPI001455D425|nr:NGFI-A-binding protein 1-like [Asterias rubens]XP_033625041.1 NGFI-A-binding protein 1-like [Asterias rubens]